MYTFHQIKRFFVCVPKDAHRRAEEGGVYTGMFFSEAGEETLFRLDNQGFVTLGGQADVHGDSVQRQGRG